ncbi:MAG: hypothetical protein E3J56_06175 [Candidatus Aminicenantes bacterium]|nr:MAG: hypothetical protein E3J56_06175 [Candidatus Aminicenantes bacterium]
MITPDPSLDVFLQGITSLDVDKYKQKRVREVLRSTVNREIACLKAIFNKAKEWGKINENQISSVKPFRVENARLEYLEKEEIARLIEACPSYLEPIVTAALNTGMRKGEVLQMILSSGLF